MLHTVVLLLLLCSSLHSVSRPTMSDLISMKMRDGSKKKLKIMEWISSHKSTQCLDFAHKLLNDRLSVKKLRKEHSEDDDEFVRAVLDKWLSRDDDSNWDTLVQCVDESGLDGEFLRLLKDNVPTGMYTSVVCVHVYVCCTRVLHVCMSRAGGSKMEVARPAAKMLPYKLFMRRSCFPGAFFRIFCLWL